METENGKYIIRGNLKISEGGELVNVNALVSWWILVVLGESMGVTKIG